LLGLSAQPTTKVVRSLDKRFLRIKETQNIIFCLKEYLVSLMRKKCLSRLRWLKALLGTPI
jgi:hypothetical protein